MDEKPAMHDPSKSAKEPLVGFLFFGVVGLLCFNFFLQVLSYLEACYGENFGLYANILYGLSNNCGQLLVIFYGSKISFSSRIYYSCLALSLILIAYPILAVLNPSKGVGMTLGLLLTFGLGFFNAVLQSAGFGLAGICSSKSMEFFSVGQAVAGLAPWPLLLLLNLIFQTAGLSSADDTSSGQSAVDVASTLTALAIASAVTLLMVPYFKFSLSRSHMVKEALSNLESVQGSSVVKGRSKLQVIKATYPLAFAVWFVLYVTFVVFPAEPLNWNPSYGPYPGKFFYKGMIIYVFQVFDVVGRYLVSALPLNVRQTKIASATRVVLIPLFFLASYNISFFTNDITRIILMAVFAASNGFILTWCMIHGPSQVNPDERDVSSYTMSFFLVNGIFFGSLTSLAVSKINN
jgi:hypothetical protein